MRGPRHHQLGNAVRRRKFRVVIEESARHVVQRPVESRIRGLGGRRFGRGLRDLGPDNLVRMLKLLTMSSADFLDEWFESGLLKAPMSVSGIIGTMLGVRTPGKRGYAQFHVDLDASRQAAQAAGVGVWNVDSIAQLHLESLDVFLGEVSQWSGGRDAIADEEIFVDRANSFDFVSSVDWASTPG